MRKIVGSAAPAGLVVTTLMVPSASGGPASTSPQVFDFAGAAYE